MLLNIAESLSTHLGEAWKEEYQRIGSVYAKWGALLVVFLFPLSTIPELYIEKPNLTAWYIFRFGPSVVVGIAFLSYLRLKYSHEILFEIIALCLFASGAYMVDCNGWQDFMISNITIFITAAVLVILRPFFFIINFFMAFALQISIAMIFCDMTLSDYFLMKGVNILIVVAIACFSMATFRYFIMKNNFMHRVALQEAHFELQERNQAIIKAQKDLRFKSEQVSEQNEELKQQKEEILSQRDAIQTQKDYIEKQNRDIIGSIKYAKRIQSAMLPTEESFYKFLPDSFVLFLPRDIVSGDFYWTAKVEDKLVLAAVDCTGHGVPGAFMSLIGESQLNQIVLQSGVHDPGNILSRLHKAIQYSLQQKQNENADGMDAAVVIIDESEKTIKFAGAKNPLYRIDEDSNLEVYKADRMSIGGKRNVEDDKEFITKEIPYDEHSTYYLFSDGFADQFGGSEDRKFMIKRFKELLIKVSSKDLNDQKFLLQQAFEEWKNGYPQTDDVMVIGFRTA